MNWVYSTRAAGPQQVPIIEQTELEAQSSSHSFEPGLSSTTKWTAPAPLPQPGISEDEYMEVDQSSLSLTIFTAEVDVELSQKISAELHRSTKKNPPRALKYELIYVRRPTQTPVTRNANTLLRRGRLSMTRARKRVALSPRQWAVFSRACARTWMGEYVFGVCIPLLTLAKVWLCPRVHC